MRLPKDLFFIFLVWLGLILFGIGKAKPLLIVYCAIVSILAFFHQHAINSANVILQWMAINTALLLILAHSTRPMSRTFFLNALSALGIVLSVWVILNRAGFDPYEFILPVFGQEFVAFKPDKLSLIALEETLRVPMGPLFNTGLTSAVIASCSIAMFRKRWVWFLPFALVALFFCKSVAAFAGLVAGAFFLLYRWRKKILYGIPLLALPFLFLSRDDVADLDGRIPVWMNIAEWFKDLPSILLGRGVGYFPDFYNESYPSEVLFLQAHNEYLEWYICFGLIGLISTLALCLYVLIKGRDDYVKAIFLSSLVMSLAHFYFHVSSSAIIGLLSFAYLFAFTDRNFEMKCEKST